MKSWVMASLDALKKEFKPKESAVNAAMELYSMLEEANKPKEIGNGLKRWVVG